MVTIVIMNDKSTSGKGITSFKGNVEDDALLKKMKNSLKSGKSRKREINKTLKAILGK